MLKDLDSVDFKLIEQRVKSIEERILLPQVPDTLNPTATQGDDYGYRTQHL